MVRLKDIGAAFIAECQTIGGSRSYRLPSPMLSKRSFGPLNTSRSNQFAALLTSSELLDARSVATSGVLHLRASSLIELNAHNRLNTAKDFAHRVLVHASCELSIARQPI